jgi:hypothetical protein
VWTFLYTISFIKAQFHVFVVLLHETLWFRGGEYEDVFSCVAQCSLVAVYRRFICASCLRHRSDVGDSTSETSVSFYETAQCSIPEDKMVIFVFDCIWYDAWKSILTYIFINVFSSILFHEEISQKGINRNVLHALVDENRPYSRLSVWVGKLCGPVVFILVQCSRRAGTNHVRIFCWVSNVWYWFWRDEIGWMGWRVQCKSGLW